MSYGNIINDSLFDFGDIRRIETTIGKTWQEFRKALSNGDFRYNEVDLALKTTFLKVFDDLFTNC